MTQELQEMVVLFNNNNDDNNNGNTDNKHENIKNGNINFCDSSYSLVSYNTFKVQFVGQQ